MENGKGAARSEKNQPLRLLQQSMATTSLGKWAFAVTLGVYAFREGGTAAIGLVALVQAAPATFAAPVLGVFGDRFSRQRVLLVTNLLRAIVLAVVAFAVHEHYGPAVVFGLAALFSTISTANGPARAALIPVLARSPQEVSSATAVMGTVDTSSFLMGAGVGGIVLASTTVPFVIALCALAYLASVVLIARIPRDARPARRRAETREAELSAGLRTILHDEHLAMVVGVMAALSIVDGLINVFVIVVAIKLLSIGTAGIGYLNIARGVGGLIGGAGVLALLGRSRVAGTLALGAGALGLPLILLGLLPHVEVGVFAWAAFGLGFVLVRVSGLTLVQRLSGDRVLARVLAVLETTFVATIGLGAILAPAIDSVLGLKGALILTGALLPALTLAMWQGLKRLEHGSPVREREFALLRRCAVFEPLPLATSEDLARRLIRIEVPAGTEVITQGDVGDRFYVIANGAVEVFENGVFRRREGPGESFGEIALLRDVARTATVRAVEDTELLALDRDLFLLAVTGHADSRDAAHDVAERFLEPAPAEL
jgi:predicted MFS family arabinose efflux permease